MDWRINYCKALKQAGVRDFSVFTDWVLVADILQDLQKVYDEILITQSAVENSHLLTE